jgi:histidyl-tRNA synthetase
MDPRFEVAGRFDYGPEQYARRRTLTDAFEAVVCAYGYEQIETSALERTELLTAPWGAGMEGDLFIVPPQEDQALALRFDATLPCVRMYLAHGSATPRRWATVAECFRRDPVERDRRWSFLQLDAECLGYAGPQVDSEIIHVMVETLLRAGLGPAEFSVHVNDRRVIEDLLAQAGGSPRRLLRAIDRHGAASPSALFDALTAEAGLVPDRARWLVDTLSLGVGPDVLERVASHTASAEARAGIDALAALLALGPSADVRVDLGIVRGLDYYSALVFECFPAAPHRSALGAGGRYDRLVERLGGPPTAAVGFALGVVPLLGLLEGRPPADGASRTVDYVVGCAATAVETLARSQRILGRLRESGHRCVLIPGPQGLDALMAAGRRHGARWVLLVPAGSSAGDLYRHELRGAAVERVPWSESA